MQMKLASIICGKNRRSAGTGPNAAEDKPSAEIRGLGGGEHVSPQFRHSAIQWSSNWSRLGSGGNFLCGKV
jgi:hypothetical protein